MSELSGESPEPSCGVTPAMLWAQASHDLQQSVQALMLITRTLLGASDEAALHRAVEHMDKALYGLQGKIELLNELSKRLAAPELHVCGLAELHDRVMLEMEAVAEQHGIGLRSRSPRGEVMSDAKVLAMVFRSLIMNAIRLGRDDILVGWRQRGGHVRLEVYFKSPPIGPAQARSALIELHDRKHGRPTGALGLGLGFVAHLCRALGHGLEYRRLPASGQRIAVTLARPAAEANASRG